MNIEFVSVSFVCNPSIHPPVHTWIHTHIHMRLLTRCARSCCAFARHHGCGCKALLSPHLTSPPLTSASNREPRIRRPHSFRAATLHAAALVPCSPTRGPPLAQRTRCVKHRSNAIQCTAVGTYHSHVMIPRSVHAAKLDGVVRLEFGAPVGRRWGGSAGEKSHFECARKGLSA